MKRLIWISSVFAFIAPFLSVSASYRIAAQSPSQTEIQGRNWEYTVPFVVHNVADIEKLIQCESQGVNISRPDSDGIFSDGVLQFHRGPLDTMASSTWASFSKASGISGSPINPSDAIRMADWAIDHDLLGHWTCAHILHLVT
ncbi:MAG TPA: hypothetical protein VKB38_13325 [Terracidiphilus sp.]|nr:hypothetical protein [Terracidiphilus sp.]